MNNAQTDQIMADLEKLQHLLGVLEIDELFDTLSDEQRLHNIRKANEIVCYRIGSLSAERNQ